MRWTGPRPRGVSRSDSAGQWLRLLWRPVAPARAECTRAHRLVAALAAALCTVALALALTTGSATARSAATTTLASDRSARASAALYLPIVARPARVQPVPVATTPARRAAQRINAYRALAGLPPVAADPLLTLAAENHAHYYVLNADDPSLQGMGLHREVADRPGFTGVEPRDRATAAGYRADERMTIDENIGLVGDPEVLVDAFADTVNHRWNFIHPSLVHIGYGGATSPRIDVLTLALTWAHSGFDRPARYPGPNQTSVPTSSFIWETPDPAPGAARPLGYPITLTFPLAAQVSFAAAELRTVDGKAVPTYTTHKAWLRGLALIPQRPLHAQTRYVVSVAGTRDGTPFTETWSFTTR